MRELPILDLEAIHRLREWGGEGLPRKMVEIFLANSPSRMDQIRKGIEEADSRNVEAGAHSLKSSAGNVGGLRLQELLKEVEALGASQELQEARGRLPTLAEVFQETCRALEDYLEGPPEEGDS